MLGSNFCEASAQRVARSIGKIDEILQSIDNDCNRYKEIKSHSKTDPAEAAQQIVGDLISQNAFVYMPGREGYQSFPHFNSNLLEQLDYRDLHQWMKDKLSLWSNMYEK